MKHHQKCEEINICPIKWIFFKIKKISEFLFFKHHLPITLVIFSTGILGGVSWYYFSRSFAAPPSSVFDACTLQKMSFDIFIEMNKLLLSIALLLITGIGIFIMNRYSNSKIEPCCSHLLWISAYLSGVLSIFFGYLLYDKFAEMTYNGMFTLRNSLIFQLRSSQFYLLLLSVILFFFFFLTQIKVSCSATNRKLNDRKNNDNE